MVFVWVFYGVHFLLNEDWVMSVFLFALAAWDIWETHRRWPKQENGDSLNKTQDLRDIWRNKS